MSTMLHADVIDILDHFDAEERAQRTLLKQVSVSPKVFHLSSVLVMIWALLALAFSTMILVQLPDPIAAMHHHTKMLFYTFQIPVAILVAGLLGQRYGLITLALYLAMGLGGLPLFAGGGGPHYIFEVTVGYLLGYLLLPAAVDKLVTRAYQNTGWFRGRSLWIVVATLLAVVVVHLAGITGITLHGIEGSLTWRQVGQWISALTFHPIAYDVLFGFMALSAVRLGRILFWFCLY